MVAYHFPPLAGSSGIQRTLRFAQHLPKFGWEPLVLTIDPRAYERTSNDLLDDIPSGTVVRRVFAFDTARHLSIGGRYFSAMARPDRWVSWKFGAVREGMKMVKEFRPQAIWTTYPIATAHLIGAALCERSGLPWIADFRDPMVQENYPADPQTRESFRNVEKQTFSLASLSTFTTPGAAKVYQSRYPDAAKRITVLENGYDEDTFTEVEKSGVSPRKIFPGAITLLHSGIVYPSERDPTKLFEALERLKTAGKINADNIRIRFRASVHDDFLNSLAEKYDVKELIDCQPPIPYREALAEMFAADGLLVMQASNCNEQIPAKVYEYLRTKRPILALTDPCGDTANTLRNAGIREITPLDSATDIEHALLAFIDAVASNKNSFPSQSAIEQASREGRTRQLVKLLDSVSTA